MQAVRDWILHVEGGTYSDLSHVAVNPIDSNTSERSFVQRCKEIPFTAAAPSMEKVDLFEMNYTRMPLLNYICANLN